MSSIFDKKKKYSESKVPQVEVNFNDLQKIEIPVVLTGDVIAILQDMMMLMITTEGALRATVSRTSGDAVGNTMDFITEINTRLAKKLGVKIPKPSNLDIDRL